LREQAREDCKLTRAPFLTGSAALVFGSLATSAIAETLGEHPAVIVAREWSTRGIDPNTFIVLHPAATQFLAAAPAEKDKVAAD
jgi:hypothetical protein